MIYSTVIIEGEEEEEDDEGASSQLTLLALAGNLQRMNSLWGAQQGRFV
jgi:hypothetical protein